MEKRFYMSKGNRKLQGNENVAFLVWNLPAMITCPYATEHCKKYCYARKAERQYKNVLPCRERNLEFSRCDEFAGEMTDYIFIESIKAWKKGKKLYVRIHESGDFYSREYAEKWIAIARELPSVTFLAYSKSIPFFDGLTLPENFILRASLWDDTPAELREMSMQYPIYTALPRGTYEHIKCFHCDCVDCGHCLACYSAKIKNIIVDIH